MAGLGVVECERHRKVQVVALVSPSDTTSFKLGRNDRASNFADMAVISDLLEHPPFAALVNHACKCFL